MKRRKRSSVPRLEKSLTRKINEILADGERHSMDELFEKLAYVIPNDLALAVFNAEQEIRERHPKATEEEIGLMLDGAIALLEKEYNE